MSSLEGSLVPVEGTSLQEISIPTDNHVTLQRNSHGITSKHVSKQPCAYVGLPKTVSNTPAVRVTTACSDVWITRKNTPSKTHRVSKGFHIYVCSRRREQYENTQPSPDVFLAQVFDGDTLHLIAPGTKLPQVGYTVRVKASVHKKQVCWVMPRGWRVYEGVLQTHIAYTRWCHYVLPITVVYGQSRSCLTKSPPC